MNVTESKPKLNLRPLIWAIIALCVGGPVALAAYTWPTYFALLGVGIVTLGVLLGVAHILMNFWSNHTIRTETVKQSRIQTMQAGRIIHGKNGEVWVEEYTSHGIVHKALHLSPKIYSNGTYEEPTNEEALAWQLFITSGGGKRNPSSRRVGEQSLVSLPAPKLDIIDYANRSLATLVVGPQGAGKTNFFYHIIPHKMATAKTFVVDPHGNEQFWPEGVKVIGPGRDYDAIAGLFQLVHREVNARYQKIAEDPNALGTFDPWCIIVDEWALLVGQLGSVAEEFIALCLEETRKVRISTILAGHSELSKLTGLEGKTDMRKGLLTVRLKYSRATGERSATLDFNDGNGQHPAQLLHPHPDLPDFEAEPSSRANGRGVLVNDVIIPDPDLTEAEEDAEDLQAAEEDAEFVRLVNEAGLSRSEAARQAYGSAYGGSTYYRGKAALEAAKLAKEG